jgi:hypothetical protein
MENELFRLHAEAEFQDFLEDNENRVFYINKETTRVGATTTYTKYLCDYAKKNDKRLLILEPTNAIIEGTVKPAYPGIFWLRKNADLCTREDVKRKHAQFLNVYGYLPSSDCEHCGVDCKRKGIREEIPTKNLIATTYAKVYFDKEMLKLINPDIILT